MTLPMMSDLCRKNKAMKVWKMTVAGVVQVWLIMS